MARMKAEMEASHKAKTEAEDSIKYPLKRLQIDSYNK